MLGVHTEAATDAFRISENQPFIDGNKRTALAAALACVLTNGFGRTPDPQDRLYDAMLALADRRLTKDGVANVLAELTEGLRLPLVPR